MHPAITRCINLPWKDDTPTDVLVRELTRSLKTPQGTMELFPIQADALYQAARVGGLLGLIPVGQGKTLTALLLPTVLEAKRPMIMTRSALSDQMMRDMGELQYHWKINRDIRVVGFSKLSSQNGARILAVYQPDLIILDEAHRVLRNDSARTRRMVRYLEQNPDTEVCAMTGTMFSSEIEDMRRLAQYTLGDGAPVPWEDNRAMRALARVIDPQKRESPTKIDWAWASAFADIYESGAANKVLADAQHIQKSVWGNTERGMQDTLVEATRKGFALRLRGTPGVVASQNQTVKSSLWLNEIEIETDPVIQNLYDYVERTSIDPDGFEIEYALHVHKTLGQLSSGFYYRFVWPNGVRDDAWLRARNDWHKFVRESLENDAAPGYDSPGLIFKWWERNDPDMVLFREWYREKQKTWLHPDGKHRSLPPRETVWISFSRLEQALGWARKQKEPIIIWYKHQASEEWFRAQPDVKTYGTDDDAPDAPEQKISAMSIKAHGEGRNLQAWAHAIIAELPSKGAWEQLLGRLHRRGQENEDVIFHVLVSTEYDRQKLEVAREVARANQQRTGTAQKLCHCLPGIPKD